MKPIPRDEGWTNMKNTMDNFMKQSCYKSSNYYTLKKFQEYLSYIFWGGGVSLREFEPIVLYTARLTCICLPLLKHDMKKYKGFAFFPTEMLSRQRFTFIILGPKIQEEWLLVYPVNKVKLMETHMHIRLQFSR